MRSLAATLAARGVPISGLRVPLAPVETIPTPPTFKPTVDAALLGCVERLGGDSAEATRRLAALHPGGFGPFVYFKSAAGAVGPLLPRERLSETGAAWLCAYLGYDNGATFENLAATARTHAASSAKAPCSAYVARTPWPCSAKTAASRAPAYAEASSPSPRTSRPSSAKILVGSGWGRSPLET